MEHYALKDYCHTWKEVTTAKLGTEYDLNTFLKGFSGKYGMIFKEALQGNTVW